MDDRDLVPPDGLPRFHQGRAAHRDQRDPGRAMTMRLAAQPGEAIDRASELTFSWNGRPYSAYAGDTIVSALAAAGERVFSRCMKYHRPRGLLTSSLHVPGRMVQEGDAPHVLRTQRLV